MSNVQLVNIKTLVSKLIAKSAQLGNTKIKQAKLRAKIVQPGNSLAQHTALVANRVEPELTKAWWDKPVVLLVMLAPSRARLAKLPAHHALLEVIRSLQAAPNVSHAQLVNINLLLDKPAAQTVNSESSKTFPVARAAPCVARGPIRAW